MILKTTKCCFCDTVLSESSYLTFFFKVIISNCSAPVLFCWCVIKKQKFFFPWLFNTLAACKYFLLSALECAVEVVLAQFKALFGTHFGWLFLLNQKNHSFNLSFFLAHHQIQIHTWQKTFLATPAVWK